MNKPSLVSPLKVLLAGGLVLLNLWVASGQANYYYPPLQGAWDTVEPADLGWCSNELDSLDAFLKSANSKSFVILHRGKIAHERYFGTFRPDSLWYWASAGKTLMATLVGIAQSEGYLMISDKSSDYLDTGWTDAPLAKEQLITIADQLQMTTGLDYTVPDLDCVADTCLLYRRDAGQQWYYHNAPYLLVHDVLTKATGQTVNNYLFQKLRNTIGLRGAFIGTLYFSTARDMARFGHLLLGEGQWNGQPILTDTNYFQQMTQPSQSLNPAYGYLTWLNGQSSYIQPGWSGSFNGPLVASAPPDMFMAAGKNDQRIYVVPSWDLVVVRQGKPADSVRLALSGFDHQLWSYLNRVICNSVRQAENSLQEREVYPNPVQRQLRLKGAWSSELIIVGAQGRRWQVRQEQGRVWVNFLAPGAYRLWDAKSGASQTFLKQ